MNLSLRRPLAAARLLLIGAACLLPVAFSQASREGAASGVKMCLNVLVPSLFPMMALTNLFVKSGLCMQIGSRLNRVTKTAFGLSGSFAPVILMALLGGYPVGANGIASLLKQKAITEQEAKRAALFCVCAGPGFVISFVGTAVYENIAIGFILFTAQVMSVLLSGIITKVIDKEKLPIHSESELNRLQLTFGDALVESVYEAGKGMAAICAFVLLFSALTGILPQMIPDIRLQNAAYALLEVCTAVTKLSADCPVTWVAFAVGFGGVCVHFQIFAALGKIPVNKWLFFLFRIIQGALTAGLTVLGLKLFPQETAVFSTAKTESTAFFGGSALSCAVLVGVTVCFLVSVKQHYHRIK